MTRGEVKPPGAAETIPYDACTSLGGPRLLISRQALVRARFFSKAPIALGGIPITAASLIYPLNSAFYKVCAHRIKVTITSQCG